MKELQQFNDLKSDFRYFSGDFAVLLKAGMSMKEAIVYNMISSILCLLGMSLGVVLGQNDHVKLWVFAAAAGMFLYIALVDMVCISLWRLAAFYAIFHIAR